jgi:hypothetical protein
VDPGPESYAEITASLAGYLEVAGYGEMFTAAGFGEAVERAASGAGREDLLDALPEDAGRRIGLVGDAPAVRSRLEAYAAAGLDEIVLVPATAGDPRRAHADGHRRHALTAAGGDDVVVLDEKVARAPQRRVGPVRRRESSRSAICASSRASGTPNPRCWMETRSGSCTCAGSRLPEARAGMMEEPLGMVTPAMAMSSRATRCGRKWTGGLVAQQFLHGADDQVGLAAEPLEQRWGRAGGCASRWR